MHDSSCKPATIWTAARASHALRAERSLAGQGTSTKQAAAHTFRQQHDVIKQVISLWRRLQQRNQHCGLSQMGEMAQRAHDLEGGVAVQPGADFVQEEGFLGAD